MMAAANTHDCFRELIGRKVVGCLFEALPLNSPREGTKTLVLDDGRGLTIASNGSYWIDSISDVGTAIERTRNRLRATQRDLEHILTLAGEEANA